MKTRLVIVAAALATLGATLPSAAQTRPHHSGHMSFNAPQMHPHRSGFYHPNRPSHHHVFGHPGYRPVHEM